MMEFLTNYWGFIVIAIAALAVAGVTVFNFIKQPTSEQMKQVSEWLLYAVTEAEKQFGSKTGSIKLSYAYDMFITKFPVIAKMISFDVFSSMVDGVLVRFRNMLESNKEVKNYVEGE